MEQLINKIKQYKIKISVRSVCIALIAAFFLVAMLFVTLYIASVQYQSRSQPGTEQNGDSLISGDPSEISGSRQPGQEDPAEDPPDGAAEDLPDGAGTDQTHDPSGENEPEDPDEDPAEDPDEDPADVPSPGGTKVAYLTFDDGPERDITPYILDILLAEDIKATFFIIAQNQGVDDLFQRIIDEGHELGNHSYSHDYIRLYNRTVDDFRSNVRRAHDFIEENFGYTMTSFRFPGGIWEAGNGLISRIDAIRELGYRHYQWHVDSDDWRRNSTAEVIVNNVLNYTAGREHVIILLHDNINGHETVEALPELIKGLREQGYTFSTVNNFPANRRTGLSNNS